MSAHLEILCEELSMEAALDELLPQLVPPGTTFSIVSFQGKTDLLRKLPHRLRGYARWLSAAPLGVCVLIDRDQDDCHALKAQLEAAARQAGLSTKSSPRNDGSYDVLNRIVVEELEAWFFGDVAAVTRAYAGVSPNLATRAAYRDPDAIRGGTAEAFGRVLAKAGHHQSGLRKVEAARAVARHLVPDRNRSASFAAFRQGLHDLVKVVDIATEGT